MIKIDIFGLAGLQLSRQGKDPNKNLIEVLDKAIVIRRWLDKHSQDIAIKIMQGERIYRYGNKIKTYKGVV